ncbi:MAG: hypothetical protein J5777_00735 [Clostridiales bacterium]|nr:hypothetical protein [Clostridiales bacterium]
MATLTRLATTLTARFYPSQSLTDAFYLDGRLCGKRETRQADITIDKDERGFFLSVFTHPTIQGFEPGSLPPFEPQLRELCNEVKNGHKEIDGMIEKFLSTAVEVAGALKLSDNQTRNPYFSGVIVRDSEAFAVTIGNGLAFLYRDDTVFPLTDAGIPMEPIDAYGNRVGDFQYYCSSKTANALWSNFFTLTPNDCIILCNKAVYDALGQREILRILTDAEDQCDAAGLILTQASARMPNTPMQISISFVESVSKEEKRGLFGRRKKEKSYEDEPHEITESTVEGGEVGAAAKAIADAGFVNLDPEPEVAADAAAAAAGLTAAAEAVAAPLVFGENATAAATAASTDALLEFPDKKEPEKETSAEEVMKNIFGEMKESAKSEAEAVQAAEKAAADFEIPGVPSQPAPAAEPAPAPVAEPSSPFVAKIGEHPEEAVKAAEDAPARMKTVSSIEFVPDVDDEPTKPVDDITAVLRSAENGAVIAGAVAGAAAGINSAAPEAKPVEPTVSQPIFFTSPFNPTANQEAPAAPAVPAAPAEEPAPVEPAPAEPAPAVVNTPGEIVFTAGTGLTDTGLGNTILQPAGEPFDPYGKASSDELKNAPPLVFGDDASMIEKPVQTEPEGAQSIPVPDFDLQDEKPVVKEEDKLGVDFPETDALTPPEEPAPAAPETTEEPIAEEPLVTEDTEPVIQAATPAPAAVSAPAPAPAPAPAAGGDDDIILPFGNMVSTVDIGDKPKSDDIPQMPLYDGGNFDTPVNAVGSEEKIDQPASDVSAYGDYGVQDVAPDIAAAVPPYQPYGGEAFPTSDQNNYGTYNTQQTAYVQGGVPMSDNNGFAGGYGNGQQNGGSYDPNYGAPVQGQQGYPDQYSGYDQGYQQDYQNQGYDSQGYPYQQGYEQQGYQSQQSYEPQGYQSQQGYDAQGYSDQSFGAPAQEQAASASSSASLDDEWFNNILGVDNSGEVVDDGGQFGFSGPQAPVQQRPAPTPQQQAQYTNPGQSAYRPSGAGPSSVGGRAAGGAPRSPLVGGGRSGGNGGGRKMKLNRNGYMFLAFVAILIICIIIVIALIARGCSKKPAETSLPTYESTSETIPTSATTKATVEDKSAPIGVFIFSDSVGYRTWWDLFHYVYKIDLDNENDPRIQTIIKYNAQDPSTYTPHSGDRLLLPPLGVIAGTIPVTFKPGGAQTTETTAAAGAGETTQATDGSIKLN